jgi:serine protease
MVQRAPAVLSPFKAAQALTLLAMSALVLMPLSAKAATGSADTDRLIVKYRDASHSVLRSGRLVQEAQSLPADTLQLRVNRAQGVAAQKGLSLNLLRQTGVGAHVFKLNRSLGAAEVKQLAAQLQAGDASIEYVEPDLKMKALAAPNDSYYSKQWDLYETTGGIRAPAAWDLSSGAGVVVAVLDTGILAHADLSGQTVAGYDMISLASIAADGGGRDSDASDPGDWNAAGECGSGSSASNSSWHGTHVAGTIAAKGNNATGIAGIAYGAKIQPVRVLGKCGGYSSDIADAMVWAAGGTVSGVGANATPAKVINLSLGGTGSCGTTTQNAINSARARGAVVVVAAGNEAADVSTSSPANCAGVIAVAATDRYGARAYYSNYGSGVTLAAPGGDGRSSASNAILSTFNTGTTTPGTDAYAWAAGTSMAAPHVAGVAALMFALKPAATPDQIAAALKSSARAFPASCSGCGAGLLDAAAALTAIGAVSTPTITYAAVTEVENNNSAAQAQLLSGPSLVTGALSSSNDVDFFKLSLPAGKTLSALLTPASGKDYDLILRNAAGAIVALSQNNGGGVAETISYANGGSSALTLYVQVRYYSGGGGGYTLKLGW